MKNETKKKKSKKNIKKIFGGIVGAIIGFITWTTGALTKIFIFALSNPMVFLFILLAILLMFLIWFFKKLDIDLADIGNKIGDWIGDNIGLFMLIILGAFIVIALMFGWWIGIAFLVVVAVLMIFMLVNRGTGDSQSTVSSTNDNSNYGSPSSSESTDSNDSSTPDTDDPLVQPDKPSFFETVRDMFFDTGETEELVSGGDVAASGEPDELTWWEKLWNIDPDVQDPDPETGGEVG